MRFFKAFHKMNKEQLTTTKINPNDNGKISSIYRTERNRDCATNANYWEKCSKINIISTPKCFKHCSYYQHFTWTENLFVFFLLLLFFLQICTCTICSMPLREINQLLYVANKHMVNRIELREREREKIQIKVNLLHINLSFMVANHCLYLHAFDL